MCCCCVKPENWTPDLFREDNSVVSAARKEQEYSILGSGRGRERSSFGSGCSKAQGACNKPRVIDRKIRRNEWGEMSEPILPRRWPL